MTIVSADALGEDSLLDLFNAGFSDYVVPLQLDAKALRGHVRTNDLDLARSPVVMVDGEAASFAFLGVRGEDAWIGGMATAPAHRRAGLARIVLDAAIAAARDAGCRTVWLEVVDSNAPAIALYASAGFERVRDVVVWTLAAGDAAGPPARALGETAARAWIAAHRDGREPWQRADATLAHLRAGGEAHTGLSVERGGDIAAAAVCRMQPTAVTVLQAAALDAAAAADVLLAAAGAGRGLTLANAPADGVLSVALAGLGATAYARQHEMRRTLR
jgi:GNAT superfamily N-acetyltransferase